MQLIARQGRGLLRQEALLDLARQRELPVHLALLGVLLHEPRVLDLGRGHVGERGQQAQIGLFERPVAHAAVDVDETHDLAGVLERRRQDRLDAREADRVRERNSGARGRVHEEQSVAFLDDRGDERLRQPDVLGRDPLGHAHDRRRELARRPGAKEDEAAVGVERLEDLVHEEAEELVDRDVAQELDRELVDDPERLDQLAELLGGQARVGLRGVRAQQLGRGLEDGVVERVFATAFDPHAGRRLGLDLERHAAHGDPVAGLERLDHGQALAVQERPVARAEVLDRECPVVAAHDAGVLAREHLVRDRQIVHRRPADRGHGSVERQLARGHAGGGDVEVKHFFP